MDTKKRSSIQEKKKKLIVPAGLLAAAGAYYYWCWFPHRTAPRKDRRRVLCIGDSITFGAGVKLTRWRDSYPSILNSLLGDGYQVLNYGVSGATAQDEGDMPYPSAFRSAAAKTEPELCLFMLGTNDSKPYNWDAQRYETAVEAWMEEIRNYPSRPRIVLMIPPAAFPVDGEPVAFDILDEVIRNEIRPILMKIAEKEGLELIDLYEISEDHPEWFGDGVHPNAEGDRVFAEFIYDRINKTGEDHENAAGCVDEHGA